MQYFIWQVRQQWRWPAEHRKTSRWSDVQAKLSAELLAVVQDGANAHYEIPADAFGTVVVMDAHGTIFRYVYPLHKEVQIDLSQNPRRGPDQPHPD